MWFRFETNLFAGCGELNDLLDEARLAMLWREYARAVDLWKLALALVGREAGTTQRAEILEGIELAEKARVERDHQLAGLIAQIHEQPEDAERHFRLGSILSALGDGEGVLREY